MCVIGREKTDHGAPGENELDCFAHGVRAELPAILAEQDEDATWRCVWFERLRFVIIQLQSSIASFEAMQSARSWCTKCDFAHDGEKFV